MDLKASPPELELESEIILVGAVQIKGREE